MEDSQSGRWQANSHGFQVSPPTTRDVRVTGRRVLAYLFDCMLLMVLTLVLLTPLLFVSAGALTIFLLAALLLVLDLAITCAYYIILEGYRGQTLGKMLLGVEVIDENTGGVPGPKAAAMRLFLLMFFDGLGGIFCVLASDKRQRLGDMAANTLVVRKAQRAA